MSLKKTFVESLIQKAQAQKKHIVLPEGTDERLLKATKILIERKIADVTLLGNEATIVSGLKQLGVSPSAVSIIDPETSPKLDEYTNIYYELRKAKGMPPDEAKKLMKLTRFYGTMMLKQNEVDGLVAGATFSTKDTITPALQFIKAKPGVALVSSLFFMVLDTKAFIFSDCGLVEYPTAAELAEIALESANTAINFGIPPLVAMLSYSTKGSASSPATKLVIEATKLAQQKLEQRFGANSPVSIDGELQGDAALVESVGQFKSPGSPVAGKASVLIFPNLDAGNICYKLTQRLGGADAYGPILQGLAKPVNDLSRGCTAEDIVGIVAITAIQAQGVSK